MPEERCLCCWVILMVRVSETRPRLSIPSRNTDRGVKADTDVLHRSTPSNILRSTRTAGVSCRLCQLCAIDTDNSIKCIVLVEGNILISQEKTSAETQINLLNAST